MNMINKSFIPGPRSGAHFSITRACLSFWDSRESCVRSHQSRGPRPSGLAIASKGPRGLRGPLSMDAIIHRAGAMRLYTHGNQGSLSK